MLVFNSITSIQGRQVNRMNFMQKAQMLGKAFLAQRRGFATDEAASGVAEQILEISVGLILIGTVEVLGIGMIVNASTQGWDSSVKTMFTVVLVILAVIADIYIFMNVAKKQIKK